MTTTEQPAPGAGLTAAVPAQPTATGGALSPAQVTWTAGDYRRIGPMLVGLSERLAEDVDLRHGERVLDVATGTGNLALAAARRGAVTTGIDIAPPLVEHAAERARVEGLDVTFSWGDAHALPAQDDAYDVTLSAIGVMFAPDQARAAAELVRVTRPGGRIGLVCWTPDGFLGELFRTMGAHVPPPPGAVPPVRWGTLQGLADLFGDRVQWTSLTHGDWRLRFASPRAYVEYFAEHYGPTVKALEKLDERGGAALLDAVEAVVARYNVATDGTAAWDSRYLQAIGTVR
jgi:SAM-dependent methyltransferase